MSQDFEGGRERKQQSRTSFLYFRTEGLEAEEGRVGVKDKGDLKREEEGRGIKT